MARIIGGSVNITGTRVQLSSVDEHVLNILVKGTALNKGLIDIGDIAVTAGTGFSLEPGESHPLPPALFAQDDGRPHTVLLSDIYAAAVNNGDDVEFLALVTG